MENEMALNYDRTIRQAFDGLKKIRSATIDLFGVRCNEYEKGCPSCDAWNAYFTLCELHEFAFFEQTEKRVPLCFEDKQGNYYVRNKTLRFPECEHYWKEKMQRAAFYGDNK